MTTYASDRLKGSFYMDGVAVDYDHSECTCAERPCRCTTILRAVVDYVNVQQIAKSLSLGDVDTYAADRILRIFKAYLPNRWRVAWMRGYYGEEISGAFLSESEPIRTQIDAVAAMNTNGEKIERLLTLEYGHVLPHLRGLDWQTKTINKGDLIFCQQGHYRKIDRAIVDQYKNYSLPRGLVTPSATPGKFDLVDGYHRCAAGKDEIVVFVGNA